MNHATCQKCGSDFEYEAGRGRPRKYCEACRRVDTRRRRVEPATRDRTCSVCREPMRGIALKKYCSSACKWRGRVWGRVECMDCGQLTGYTKYNAPEQARCQACRRSPCGTVGSYRRGCRCDDCKAANAQSMREYAAKRKERDGVSLYSQNRKHDGAHGHFIPRADRLAIYERDGWACQLCFEPVDKDLHYNDRMAATLDHIEPQSSALIPDHSAENLRLSHRACNSRRWSTEVVLDDSVGRPQQTSC